MEKKPELTKIEQAGKEPCAGNSTGSIPRPPVGLVMEDDLSCVDRAVSASASGGGW